MTEHCGGDEIECPKDLAQELRVYLKDDLGLALQSSSFLNDSQSAFAVCLGLMREQTCGGQCTSAVPCPFIDKFPEQLCGSWAKTPEGLRAREFLDAGGDAMGQQKMWLLLLYTWLGAGGVHGYPWQRLRELPDVVTYEQGKQEQALEAIKYAMLCVQHFGNHTLFFFGSDGRDKGLRLSCDNFAMLLAWHGSVPTLAAAFDEGAAYFVRALNNLPGLGELALKEIMSYLGTSTHPRFQSVAFTSIVFGSGARGGARTFLGINRRLLEDVTELRPQLQEYMEQHFTIDCSLSVVDIEIFLCYGLTYARLVSQLRGKLAGRRFQDMPYGQALRIAREVNCVPRGWTAYCGKGPGSVVTPPRFDYREIAVASPVAAKYLTTPLALATFWGMTSLADHLREVEEKRKLGEKKRNIDDATCDRDAMRLVTTATSSKASRADAPSLQLGRSDTVRIAQREKAEGMARQAVLIVKAIEAKGGECVVQDLIDSLTSEYLQSVQSPDKVWNHYKHQLLSNHVLQKGESLS